MTLSLICWLTSQLEVANSFQLTIKLQKDTQDTGYAMNNKPATDGERRKKSTQLTLC